MTTIPYLFSGAYSMVLAVLGIQDSTLKLLNIFYKVKMVSVNKHFVIKIYNLNLSSPTRKYIFIFHVVCGVWTVILTILYYYCSKKIISQTSTSDNRVYIVYTSNNNCIAHRYCDMIIST